MAKLFDVFADRQFQSLAAAHFQTVLGNTLLVPVLPVYLHGLGFAESQIGVIMGSTAMTALAVRPFVGVQVDTRGSRPVLLVGQVLLVCSILGLLVGRDVVGFSLARMLFGVAAACYGTGAVTFASSIGVGPTNTNSIAYFTLTTMLGLGLSMGVSQAAYEALGFRVCVWVSCALITAGLAVMAFRARNIPAPARGARRASFWRVVRSRAVLASSVGQFGASFAFGALFTFVPLAAVKSGVALYSPFFIGFAVTVIVSRFFVQRSIDFCGLEKTCVYAYLVMVASVLCLVWRVTPATLAVAGTVFGAGFGVTFPAFVLIIVRRIPAASRGTALGVLIAFGDIGMALAAALLGAVAERFGYMRLFAAVAVLLLASLAALFKLLRLGGRGAR